MRRQQVFLVTQRLYLPARFLEPLLQVAAPAVKPLVDHQQDGDGGQCDNEHRKGEGDDGLYPLEGDDLAVIPDEEHRPATVCGSIAACTPKRVNWIRISVHRHDRTPARGPPGGRWLAFANCLHLRRSPDSPGCRSMPGVGRPPHRHTSGRSP